MKVGLYIRDYMEYADRPMYQQVEAAAEVCRRQVGVLAAYFRGTAAALAIKVPLIGRESGAKGGVHERQRLKGHDNPQRYPH